MWCFKNRCLNFLNTGIIGLVFMARASSCLDWAWKHRWGVHWGAEHWVKPGKLSGGAGAGLGARAASRSPWGFCKHLSATRGWALLDLGVTMKEPVLPSRPACQRMRLRGNAAAAADGRCKLNGLSFLCASCSLFCLTLLTTLYSFVLWSLLHSWRIWGSEMLWKLPKV